MNAAVQMLTQRLKTFEGFVTKNADKYDTSKRYMVQNANAFFSQIMNKKGKPAWTEYSNSNAIVFKLDGNYFVIDTDDKESDDFVCNIMAKYGVTDNMTPSLSNHLLGKKNKNHYWFQLPTDIRWTCTINYIKGGHQNKASKLDLLGSENRVILENIDCLYMLKNIPMMSQEMLQDILEYVPSALLGQELNFTKATKQKKTQNLVTNEIVYIDDNECPIEVKKFIDENTREEDAGTYQSWSVVLTKIANKYGKTDLGLKAAHYFSAKDPEKYEKDAVTEFYNKIDLSKENIQQYKFLKLETNGECLLDVEEIMSQASTVVNSVVNSDEEAESVAFAMEEVIIVSSEEDVAVKAYERLKSTFVYVNKQYYGKWGNIWCNDNTQWEALLCNAIVKLKIIKRTVREHKFGTQNIDVVWCDSYAHLMAVYKRVRQMIVSNPRNDMYELFHSTTLGKICFEDGVYNFRTKKFFKWDSKELKENPVYSCVKITRNFPFNNKCTTATDLLAEDVKKADKVFFQAMGKEQGEKFLAYLARVTAGEIKDKMFSCCMFNRDCSKGVINDWFMSAFGEYVGQADSNSFVLKESFGDSEKENGWMIPLQYCRHVFVSELEVDPNNSKRKINSKTLKSICSGGDPMKARLMRENGIMFRLQCGINIMGNDMMPFSSNDVLEKCLMLTSVTQFKTQEYIDKELQNAKDCPILYESLKQRLKVADQTIRDKIKTDEWADALVRIMIRYYTEKPVVIDIEGEQQDDECEALDKKVVASFKFTGIKTDTVTNENLRAFANRNNTSLRKLKETMVGIDKRVKDYKSGSVKGMSGILEILVE